MKALILAAGYGTRLYPLTKNTPKPLLKIGGGTILEHILKNIEEVAEIDEVYIISNDRFYEKIEAWAAKYKSRMKIKVLNDYTTSNENRLGAIKDIEFVISRENVNDDLLVVAGDNLFDLSLKDFVKFASEKSPCAVLCAYDIKDIQQASLYGIVEVGEENEVVSFQEKPQHPKSTLAAMAIYFLPAKNLKLLPEYLSTQKKMDAPGFFLKWLSERDKAYAYVFEGKWFDIGSIESYKEAQNTWNK